MAIVLKQFAWSPNGYDVEILNPGDDRAFGASLAGLVGEGFVSAATDLSDRPEEEPSIAEAADDAVAVLDHAPAAAEPARTRKRK